SIEARILAMLPSRSPTVGLIWARPMRRSRMDPSVCVRPRARARGANASWRARWRAGAACRGGTSEAPARAATEVARRRRKQRTRARGHAPSGRGPHRERGRCVHMKRAMNVAGVAIVAMSATVAVAAGLLVCGCAAKEAKWSGEMAAMVVYAKSIPLYPGARAKDAMGSDSYGDTPDSHSEGMAIWFEVKDFDRAKVLDWYQQRLPNARTSMSETGAVELTLTPPNGEPGEDMGVSIGDTDFRVFEHTKAGKHKKT